MAYAALPRDDSLETVKRNEQTYGIPLVVVSYKQLYDWTMDEIVAQIGTKSNCTFCGVFRQAAHNMLHWACECLLPFQPHAAAAWAQLWQPPLLGLPLPWPQRRALIANTSCAFFLQASGAGPGRGAGAR